MTLKSKSNPSLRMLNLSFLSFAILFASISLNTAQARKPGVAGEAEIKAGNFEAASSKLEAIDIKNADEWYLLGKAYMGLGQKQKAHAGSKSFLWNSFRRH